MSFHSSFTVFASYGDRHKMTDMESRSKTGCGEKPVVPILTSGNESGAVNEQRVVPGTLLQDWMLPSHNFRRHRPSIAIRALPFEPLAHQRHLPKTGTISPVNVQEHGCTGQPHRIPPASSMASPDSPPVTEIRIPTPQTPQATAPDDDEISTPSETEGEDFKTLYLCCQRDLHESQEYTAMVTEENRMLKRQLIQLQKELFASSRTKRAYPKVSWSIPSNSSNKRAKGSPNSRWWFTKLGH